MDNDILSVVMTNYNYGQYLEQAIESVLNQTYKNFQFILIDDGSTDNSLEIIQNYLDSERITFIQNKKNEGFFSTLNTALSHCTGKYITLPSSDDILFPEFIEKQLSALLENPSLAVCCSKYAYFYTDTPEKICSLDLLKLTSGRVLNPKQVSRAIKKKKFWIPGNASIFKKDLFKKFGGLEAKYHSYVDWFALTSMGLSHGVYYIPETLAAMRKHSTAYSITRPLNQKYESWTCMIQFLKQNENKTLKELFLKSHSFYHFNIDFFIFMLKYPQNWPFFKHHLWLRFFCLWAKKNYFQQVK